MMFVVGVSRGIWCNFGYPPLYCAIELVIEDWGPRHLLRYFTLAGARGIYPEKTTKNNECTVQRFKVGSFCCIFANYQCFWLVTACSNTTKLYTLPFPLSLWKLNLTNMPTPRFLTPKTPAQGHLHTKSNQEFPLASNLGKTRSGCSRIVEVLIRILWRLLGRLLVQRGIHVISRLVPPLGRIWL